jgi:hypothetical protein
MKIWVTEKHLDEAIHRTATRDSEDIITNHCILSVAVQEQIQKGARVGFSSVLNREGTGIGWFLSYSTTRLLTGLFDSGQYERIRPLLPLELTVELD